MPLNQINPGQLQGLLGSLGGAMGGLTGAPTGSATGPGANIQSYGAGLPQLGSSLTSPSQSGPPQQTGPTNQPTMQSGQAGFDLSNLLSVLGQGMGSQSPGFSASLGKSGTGMTTVGNLGHSGAYTPTAPNASAPPVNPVRGAPFQPVFGPLGGPR